MSLPAAVVVVAVRLEQLQEKSIKENNSLGESTTLRSLVREGTLAAADPPHTPPHPCFLTSLPRLALTMHVKAPA